MIASMLITARPFPKYVTWEGGRSRRRKQQKDIERRACSQKSDIPHIDSSMCFFL